MRASTYPNGHGAALVARHHARALLHLTVTMVGKHGWVGALNKCMQQRCASPNQTYSCYNRGAVSRKVKAAGERVPPNASRDGDTLVLAVD
jgi:hypothetical protein